MARALELARRHLPHPNPRVGAVIVDPAGQVVGEGAHDRAGNPHAEIVALAAAGDRARGSTIYVTLEPCSHQGRTPPCADALIASGVSRVVVGAIDPDRRVAGQGVTLLEGHGIAVETGVLGAEAEELDPGYFHHRRTGRPLLTLKMAMTLDGQVAAADGTSQWITGELARNDAHLLRADADAVLIGAGTLATDHPRLDVRIPGYEGHQPRPIVVKGRQPLAGLGPLSERRPLIVATEGGSGEVLVVAADSNGRPDLVAAVTKLGEMGLLHILVEGGPTLARTLWEKALISRGVFYLAGMVAGGVGHPAFAGPWPTLAEANAVQIKKVTTLGTDLRVDFKVS